MTLPPSDSGDDELIARFMRELQAAADLNEVVEKFCALHPARDADFRTIAAAHMRMNAAAPEPAEVTPRLTPGEMLGDFRVVRFIAHGGMGEIYEAEQVCLSRRRVALKVIRQGKVSPDARARFLREQEVLAKLHQTNIVPVFAAGEHDELQYFAMQYIDGATLGHVVQFLRSHRSRSGGANPTPSLAKLVESVVEPRVPQVAANASTATQSKAGAEGGAAPDAFPVLTDEYCRSVASSLADVADALDAAHRAGVLHRDVKPSNLMAERSGKCWVIDFGLAGLVSEPSTTDGIGAAGPDAALTATGTHPGTLPYMSPEQFDGSSDRRSDVWALGVTLYELLALQRPFAGPSRENFRQQVTRSDPPRLKAITRNVPRDLEAICQKAMQKAPEDRYATAADFATDLRRWLRAEPTEANPPWLGRRLAMWGKRNPGWAAMVAVACLAFCSVAGLLLHFERRLHTEAVLAMANRETERATAAEREVSGRQRQLLTLQFQTQYSAARRVGWRDPLWSTGVSLAQYGTEPELRDQMAAVLSGLDAKPVPEFNEGAATFVAFDPSGRRLLMGGYRGRVTGGVKEPDEPTRVRDLVSGEVRRSTQAAVGPVGWRGEVPVQLVPPTEGRRAFVLWNVDRNEAIEEFALPDGRTAALAERVEGMSVAGAVLSADAGHVAAIADGAKGERQVLLWKSGRRDPWARVPVPANETKRDTEALALSADGTLLAVGTLDGRATVWSLLAEPKRAAERKLGVRVTGLAFARSRHLYESKGPQLSPEQGWLFAAGSEAGTVAVWDLADPERVMLTRESPHEVFGLAFGPDGMTLATAGRVEGALWDIATGRRLLRVVPTLTFRNWIPAVAFSLDGKSLATGSTPAFGSVGAVDLYRLEPNRGVHSLRGLAGAVKCVTVTANGRFAAGLTQEWQAAVWDILTDKLLLRVEAPQGLYPDHASIRLTEDGRFLLIASGKEARRWEVPGTPDAPVRPPESWPLNPAFVNCLALGADGKVLLCRYETLGGKEFPFRPAPQQKPSGCVRIYELMGGQPAQPLATHGEHARRVQAIHAAPDGSFFVVDGFREEGDRGHSIVVYEGRTGKELWPIPIPESAGNTQCFLDSTGTVLSYTPEPSRPRLRTLPYRGQSDEPGDPKEVPAVGRRYAVEIARGKGLRLSIQGSGTHFLTLDPDTMSSSLRYVFTPDGRFLAWGASDGLVQVADLPTIRERLTSAGFPGW